jgi:dTDP-glucose 4,6-dehydratase
MMRKILVTGGCGFIGSNFINYVLENNIVEEVVNIDKLTYAATESNIKKKFLSSNRYHLYIEDVCKEISLINIKNIDYIFHFAAESHVDNSIKKPKPFVQSNVMGTFSIVDWGYRHNIPTVVISTDEVYGSLGFKEESSTEYSMLKPSSVYSSTKAAADLIALSYHKTHNYDVRITRCTNNFGYYQHKEKFIPNTILKALKNEKIPVYGNGKNIREWIWVEDHCEAILSVAKKGNAGEVYNIGSGNEQSNINVVETILDIMGKDKSLIEFVEDRKGHDKRYSLDSFKIRSETGWKAKVTEDNFSEYLKKTIDFYSKS